MAQFGAPFVEGRHSSRYNIAIAGYERRSILIGV
jgi:hypothetical protein